MTTINQNIVNYICLADLNNLDLVKDLINRIETNIDYSNPQQYYNNKTLETLRNYLYTLLPKPKNKGKNKEVINTPTTDGSYIKTNFRSWEIGYTPSSSDSE